MQSLQTELTEGEEDAMLPYPLEVTEELTPEQAHAFMRR